MKQFLGTFTLLLALTLPALAQGQVRLSHEDQEKFDKHYTKWVNDTRKNDRDDIAKDVHEMQEIMAKYNIPANVPYDQIASTGSAVRIYQGRLSADDQREFDKYYTKWVNDTRKNDRDDIAKDVGRMQEIMARNNIPASVPFDQIASSAAYSSGSSPTYVPRLSVNDQREFDHYYAEWLEHTRKNDRDDVAKDVSHMQEIMARNNIPANVPFDRIASPDAASRH